MIPKMETEDMVEELRQLYPDLGDQELHEAALNIHQYFQLAWEIYEESVLSKRSGQEKLDSDFQGDQ